ncbi:hypothetical protein SLA2020_083690 [Shorea laevis]
MDTAHNAEESFCCVSENHKGLSGRSQNGVREPQNQLQKSTCSKDKNSLIQQPKNVVAIVDPPHMGLHPIVIKASRTHPSLQRLVYISCNSESLVANAIELCTPSPESLVANAVELCTPSPTKLEKGKKDNRGWRYGSTAGLAGTG